MLIFLIVFYIPVHISVEGYKELKIIINKDGLYHEVTDVKKIKEFNDLLGKQKFTKSTLKTLSQTPPAPSKQVIHIFIEGTKVDNTPFTMRIFCRADAVKYSYVEKNYFYYSIEHPEDFIQNINEFVVQSIPK